jgi:hypothetical protein
MSADRQTAALSASRFTLEIYGGNFRQMRGKTERVR